MPQHPKIEPLAREVAKECCGLPLAVVVIAGALRNVQGIYRWRCAVTELRSSVSAVEIEDMEEKVFRRLQYSYDWLKDESLKKCFLYCALFPEDYKRPKTELVQYWINEGLIDGSRDLEYAHDKGLLKLDELLEACLLEKLDFGRADCVKMHDVMRDLALRISSTEGEGGYSWSLVKAGVQLSEAPKAEDWKKTERISLMNNHLMTLPQMMPNCLMLRALLLQDNSKLEEIPLNFFVHIPALQVLDLSYTGIKFLPGSIGNLANLRGLYLNNCQNLKVIPSEIGYLAKLEIFQIAGNVHIGIARTRICYLPPEIEDLVSLKHFEVYCRPSSNTNQGQKVMKIFPRMSKLSKLERLSIYMSPHDCKCSDEFFSEGFINDISLLNNLTHLMLEVLKIEQLEYFAQQSSFWKQLTNFRLHVCQKVAPLSLAFIGWDKIRLKPATNIWWLGDSSKRVLLYTDCTGKAISDEILTRVDSLVIEDSDTVQCLSKLGHGKMKELKCCWVYNCKYIETIMQTTDDLLQSLEVLHLSGLCNLKSILEGPLPKNCCFPNLTSLYLRNCHELKWVFSISLLAHVPNLNSLSVEDCHKVKEIISMEVEEDGGEVMVSNIQTLLPRLRLLKLWGLWRLRCIYSNKELSPALGWPLLEEIYISGCENLKSLPHSFSNAPDLKIIYCNAVWWEALEWEDDALKQQLCSKARRI